MTSSNLHLFMKLPNTKIVAIPTTLTYVAEDCVAAAAESLLSAFNLLS